MQVKKQQLEPDMEQQTGSKLEKEYVKVVYCCPAYLTYMQRTSCEIPGEAQAGIRIARRNINKLRYADKGDQSWVFIGRTDVEAELQYFGHLMQRADSLERTLMLGKIESRRRRG